MTNPTNPNLPAPPSMNRQTPSKGDNGGLLKIAGIALAVSLVAIFIYSYLVGGLATKKYTDVTFAPTATLTQLQADIASAKAKLDTELAGLPVTVSTQVNTSIGEFATKINQANADIGALQNQVNNLNNLQNNYADLVNKYNALSEQLTQLAEDVNEINTMLTDYETRIKNLEDKIVPSTNNPTGNELVKVSIKQQSPYLFVDTDNRSTGYLRVTITNTTGKDVENVIIGLGFDIGYNINPIVLNGNSLAGGILGFTPYPYNNLYWVTGGWGYTIKANDKLVFDVVASFGTKISDNPVKYGNIGTSQYEVTAVVESWDYK